MKKNYILQILALVLGFAAKAQEPIMGCPKVLFHSYQVTDSGCDNSIKRVGLTFFSDKVMIKYRDREKEFIPQDSVWGIRRKNDYPHRLFKDNYYRLYELSPVYKYSKRAGKSTNYFFSTTLDAPIYSYTKKNIKNYTDSATYKVIAKEAEMNRHEFAMDIYAINTRIVSNNLLGGALEIKYYPYSKIATGIYLCIAGTSIKDTFSFTIKKPSLVISEIGWLNQFDLLQKNNFRFSANLITGLAYSELLDNAIKVKVKTRTGYTTSSKKIAENYQFLLSPGLDVSVKLFSNRHNPDIYISGKARYCLAIGDTEFGMASAFSGYTFAIGFSLIGFDREQFN